MFVNLETVLYSFYNPTILSETTIAKKTVICYN